MYPLDTIDRRRRPALSPQPRAASCARGQDLPRRADRLAQHPVGRNQGRRGPRRLSSGVDARHGQQRDRPAGRRRHGHAVARADLSRLLAAADGGFPQNFWIDGDPYWKGIQLDEVAFPIMLAWRLRKPAPWAASIPIRWCWRPPRYLIDRRAGHAAGALGREQRLLAFDAGEQYRRADLRGRPRARTRRRGDRRVSRRSTPTFSNPTSRTGP